MWRVAAMLLSVVLLVRAAALAQTPLQLSVDVQQVTVDAYVGLDPLQESECVSTVRVDRIDRPALFRYMTIGTVPRGHVYAFRATVVSS